jgi:hypothetical protein
MKHSRWLIAVVAAASVTAAMILGAEASPKGAPKLPTAQTKPMIWPKVGSALPSGRRFGSITIRTPAHVRVRGGAVAGANGALVSVQSVVDALGATTQVDPAVFGVRYVLYTNAARPDETNMPVYLVSHAGVCAITNGNILPSPEPDCVPATYYYFVDATTGEVLSSASVAGSNALDQGGIVLQVPST